MPEKKSKKSVSSSSLVDQGRSDERIFTIPLRKAWRCPRTRRAKKAITIIKEYLQRHMKAENINIGKSINESVWARGIQKPPRKIKIHAKTEDEIIYSEVIGTDIKLIAKEEKEKKEKKKEEKKEKIKKEREERKKMTIQDEFAEEAGKKPEQTIKPQEPEKRQEPEKQIQPSPGEPEIS